MNSYLPTWAKKTSMFVYLGFMSSFLLLEGCEKNLIKQPIANPPALEETKQAIERLENRIEKLEQRQLKNEPIRGKML